MALVPVRECLFEVRRRLEGDEFVFGNFLHLSKLSDDDPTCCIVALFLVHMRGSLSLCV